jgi:iron(III) transport system permease protein
VVRWRGVALVLLFTLVAAPLAVPFLDHLTRQDRLFLLAGNTLLLILGTLLLAVPVGVVAAVLLYRTDLPCRKVFHFLTVLTLFVPLPLVTTAWQAALGSEGWLNWPLLGPQSDRPWAEGYGPAIWIHSQVALPWVILIVGLGLQWVEPDLEEDALLAAGPWTVLWRVTLPRSLGAIAAAAVWVAVQVSTELTVADLMLVRTFAEEVYAEFGRGGDEALARAVAVSLPMILLIALAVYGVASRVDRLLPSPAAAVVERRPFALGWARWPCFVMVCACVGMLAGVPLTALIWKTGLVGQPATWSATATVERVHARIDRDGVLVGDSILVAFLSSSLTVSVALVLCWLAVDAPRFRRALFALLALTWAVPGPIVGIGLKEVIFGLVHWVSFRPLSIALYDGPSPLPVVWAHLVRFLPLAVIGMWPVVRLVPRDLRDSIRLEGASPAQELQQLYVPLLWRAWLALVIVVAALALGEVGAVAMRVETPGWETFAHVLFDRMHYGMQHDVSALCLVLVLAITVGGLLAAGIVRLRALLGAGARSARRAGRSVRPLP